MLVLNSNDIYNAFQPPDIIKAIEEAYILQSSRQYLMPDRLHLKVQDGIQLVMPSAAQEIFCTKVVTVNQKNASRNLPIINGSVQLVKQNDGQLLSIMNGSALTATTSPTPGLPEKPALLAGKLYICLGSFKPVTGELPRTIYPLVNNIYGDVEYAKNENGDVSWPLQKKLLDDEDNIQLSQVIIGKHNVRDKTRIFKSVGMALFDLTVSQAIYKAAVQKDICTNVLL